ncbi:MAG: hypothetical protein IT288_07715 [Bdellovibrionales bacterium]|nr:hypothetical protein [Bdellovibrionales bacterium]
MSIRLLILAIIVLAQGFNAQGQERLVAKVVGEHWGYLPSLAEERNMDVVEMVLIDNPARESVPLNLIIFDSQLSREFRDRYQLKFGQTEAEQNLSAPNQFYTYEHAQGVRVTPQEDVQRKRAYGEYMVRRLTEHHVDQYAQASPNLRPVYELKERVSNVNLEVRKGYKVRLHYSLSGNYIDVKMENPLDVATKVTLQMDESSFGPSSVNETILAIGYPLTQSVSVGTHYKINAKAFSLAGYKSLRPNLSTSLTGSTAAVDPSREDSPRDDRVIIGFTWSQ